MKKSLDLLGQIIKFAKEDDLEFKKKNIGNKASLSIGESWLVNHLETLRELIILENAKSRDSRSNEEKG